MLSPKWNIYANYMTSKFQKILITKREREEYIAGGWQEVWWNVFCKWLGNDIHELRAAVVTCTRPVQKQVCQNTSTVRKADLCTNPTPKGYLYFIVAELGLLFIEDMATGLLCPSGHTSLCTSTSWTYLGDRDRQADRGGNGEIERIY